MAIRLGNNYKGPPLITLEGPSGVEWTLLKENIGTCNGIIRQRLIDYLVGVGVDVLRYAIPRTPKDTGQLRESGTVTMDTGRKFLDVARGHKDGGIQLLSALSTFTPRAAKHVAKKAAYLQSIVHFHRTAESAEGPRDIALWAHEDLNPYGGVAPAARTPMTGPKYLEKAVKSRMPLWQKRIVRLYDAVERDIYQATTRKKVRGLDTVKLVITRIKKFVFFKRR